MRGLLPVPGCPELIRTALRAGSFDLDQGGLFGLPQTVGDQRSASTLIATIDPQTVTVDGTHLTYAVTLRNPTRQAVTLGPDLRYLYQFWRDDGLPRPLEGTIEYLNVGSGLLTIPAHSERSFAMHAPRPEGLDLALTWELLTAHVDGNCPTAALDAIEAAPRD